MKTALITITAFFIFSTPSVIYGCFCSLSDPPHAFNDAEAVFIGRVLGGTEKLSAKDRNDNTYELEAGAVRFTVEELFKGSTSKKITVEIPSMKDTGCGPPGMRRDKLYLVYAYKKHEKTNKLYSGVCTRNADVNSEKVKEDLKFLRNLPPAGTGGNLRVKIWLNDGRSGVNNETFLPNTKVTIRSQDGQTRGLTTDINGEFELKRIKAGKYRVEPHLPENYYPDKNFKDIDLADRGTATAYFMASFTGALVGRVSDKNGVGYNSVTLSLLSADGDKAERKVYGHSDGENGKFSVRGIPPGEYVLRMELRHEDYRRNKEYYYPGTYNRKGAAVIKVGLGEKVEGLNFVLPSEFQVRTIEGQVFWEDGTPASDIDTLLLCPRSASFNGFIIGWFGPRFAKTNKDGYFKLESFTGKSYRLAGRIWKDGKMRYSPPQEIVIDKNLKDLKLILSETGWFEDCEN